MSARRYVTPAIAVAVALAAALAFNGLIRAPAPAQAALQPSASHDRFRQVDPKPAPGPGVPSKHERRANKEQRTQAHQDYLNALAAKLGVTSEQLIEAMKQVRIDRVNKLAQEGKITREQADRAIQRINSSPGPIGPVGRPFARRPALVGAAQALGVTPPELTQALRSGQSLAEFAQSKGMSRDDLKVKLTEVRKAALDAAVARNAMATDQAKEALERFTANLDQFIDAKPGQRAAGRR
jgi:uncharacterized protein YidB (DUF937 family)